MARYIEMVLSRWLLFCGLAASGILPAMATDEVSLDEEGEKPGIVGWASGSTRNQEDHNNLAGIYRLAIENDFTIAQAEARLRADSQQRWIGLSSLLPNVTFQYSTSESDTDSDGVFLAGDRQFPNNTRTITDSDSWNLSLSQPLFDMRAWFTFRQGVARSEQAKVEFELAQQELVLRTFEAYMAMIRANANLQSSLAQEDALESQLERINQQFDVGLVPITDVLDARAAYDQAAAQVIGDEGALETAREQLTVITGRRVFGELWRFRDDFPVNIPEPADSKQWARFARNNNLNIKLADYAVEDARLGKRQATSDHLPTVSLNFSISDNEMERDQTNLITGMRSVVPFNSRSDQISLTVTVPLPSGGRVSAARRRASANLSAQRDIYLGTIRQVTQQTHTAFSRTRTHVNQVRANERTIASTEAAMESAQTGLEVGTRNIVDVLDAIQAYSAAQRDYANSIVDYVLSVIELKRLAGTLGPRDVYAVNDWLESPGDAEQ